MKSPTLFTVFLLAVSSALFAADPAPGTTPPPPAADKPAGDKPAGDKPAGDKPAPPPAPLSAGDKKFVKDQTDGLYLVLDLIGQAKTSAQTDAVKKLTDKAKPDLDKVWVDVAEFAGKFKEPVPTELKGADKSAAERLKKADKKNWDKEFIKISGKEVKRLAHAFKDSKGINNPDLKTIADKWRAILSGMDGDWDGAEKEVAKAKTP